MNEPRVSIWSALLLVAASMLLVELIIMAINWLQGTPHPWE